MNGLTVRQDDVVRSDDALVEALQHLGVRYLTPSGPSHPPHHGDGGKVLGSPEHDGGSDLVGVLAGLAQSHDPRVRQALTALFLVRPDLATAAPQAAAALPASARDRLIYAYIAAVYLQRLWWTRWRRYLGDVPLLPPLWIDELALPAPHERFGKAGLVALAARTGGRRGATTPQMGPYLKVGQRLFGQLLAERAAASAQPREALR